MTVHYSQQLVICVVTAPQHSNNLKELSLSQNGFQQHICITFCLRTAHPYNNYISKHQHITMITTQMGYTVYTPCVTALILSECTNSSCAAARTALSRTAPNILNLELALSPGVLALVLPECTNSSCEATRTAPNSVMTTSPPGGRGGHLINNVTSYWCSIHYTTH